MAGRAVKFLEWPPTLQFELSHPATGINTGQNYWGLSMRTVRAFIEARLRLGLNATAIYQDLVNGHGFCRELQLCQALRAAWPATQGQRRETPLATPRPWL